MPLSTRLRAAVLTAALAGLATPAVAQVPCIPCPPLPGLPATPAPATPGTTATPGTPPATPAAPSTPDAPAPTPPPAPASDQLASATARQGGGEADFTSKPGIFGDLIGGATVPVAIQRFDARGNPIGTVFRSFNPATGRYEPVTAVNRPMDELLFGRSVTPQPVGTPVASTRVIENVDPSQLAAATRIPTVSRGAFKITENETPRPTTRAYLTYNFYDNVFKSVGENTPRVSLHQESFGYEQAFADQQYSVGLRLPYNQLVSTGYYNSTTVGDLTVVTKAVLSENRATGDLLSGGLAVTVPTGARGVNSFTQTNLRDVLLQPYLGYIRANGDLFVQGFTGLVVPTSSADVLLFTQSLAVGYTAYKRPCGFLTGITPVFEAHLNTPLTHRDFATQFVAFPDSLTLLGGTYFELNGRSNLGFAAGAPVTGPRPFSLQATAQLSVRF